MYLAPSTLGRYMEVTVRVVALATIVSECSHSNRACKDVIGACAMAVRHIAEEMHDVDSLALVF